MTEKRCLRCMKRMTGTICEHCGFDGRNTNAPHQLPMGTILQEQYLIGRVLGQGGFGITYLGWDMFLDTPVAIKEYYPTGMVMRDASISLETQDCSGNSSERFHHNRERFLREAKVLARFSQVPEIVQIKNFFLSHNTAYIVMEYVEGIDLKRYVKTHGGKLGVEETLQILGPVIQTLGKIHKAGIVHRDISPDNIMMIPGGAKLLDFGAVRDVGAAEINKELTKSTEAILKQGYAPIEQYQKRGSLGPWTDVYALCATICYCLTGAVPPDSPERVLSDDGVDFLSQIPGLSAQQLGALRHGLELRIENRTPSMEVLYQELFAQSDPEDSNKMQNVPVEAAKEVHTKENPSEGRNEIDKTDSSGRKFAWKKLVIPAAALLLIGALGFAVTSYGGDEEVVETESAQTEQAMPSGQCGSGLTWRFDQTSGTLSIAGSGEMDDYACPGQETADRMLPPWYDYQNDITALNISEDISSIGKFAFANLENLKQVSLENTTIISEGAFQNSGLEDVDFGQTAIIGERAFYGTLLTDIVIPDHVQKIDSGAFANCHDLKSVTLGRDTLISFDTWDIPVFSNIHKETFADFTLVGCADSIAQEYARIMGYQFEEAGENVWDASGKCGTNLNWYFDFDNGFLKIDGRGDMANYEQRSDNNSSRWAPWFGCDADIRVVSIGDEVTSVGTWAFAECDVEYVHFGAGLRKIRTQAFCGAGSLEEVVLPEGLNSLESFAFNHCTNLRYAVLPESLLQLKGAPFNMCLNMEQLFVGKDTYILPAAGYTPFSHKEEPEVPENVTIYSLEDSRPQQYAGQSGIRFGIGYYGNAAGASGRVDEFTDYKERYHNWFLAGDTLYIYGDQGISGQAYNLTDEEMLLGVADWMCWDPATSPSFARYADRIRHLVIMPGTQWLNYREFDNLYLLETVDLGELFGMDWGSLKGHFRGFENLKSIHIDRFHPADKTYAGCTGLEKVTFHENGIAGIPAGAFEGCTNLKEVWCGRKTYFVDDIGIENDDVVFFVYSGSEAERYVIDNGIDYEVIS